MIEFESEFTKFLHDFINIGFKANLNILVLCVNICNSLLQFCENIEFAFLIVDYQIQFYQFYSLRFIFLFQSLNRFFLSIDLVDQWLVHLDIHVPNFRLNVEPEEVEAIEVLDQVLSWLWRPLGHRRRNFLSLVFWNFSSWF